MRASPKPFRLLPAPKPANAGTATGESETATPALSPPEQVEAECLSLIGPQLRRMLYTLLPLSFGTTAGLWSAANHGALLLWMGLTLASSAILWFVAGFNPKFDLAIAISSRRREVVGTCGFTGVAWAIGAVFAYGSVLDTSKRLLVVCASLGVLGAMTLGTLLVRQAGIALATPIVVALSIRLLVGSAFERMVAIVMVLVGTAHAFHFSLSNKTQTVLVRNRIENVLLSRKLARSNELRLLAESEVERLADDIEDEADKDEVTGVKNRGAFRETLAELWQRADGGFDPFSVVLLDIDQYDEIAGRHGPEVADDLLRQVAKLVDHALRTDDMIARLGASQFGLLLNNALNDGAMICMERIRRKVAATPFDAGEPLVISVSASIVSWERGIGLRQLFAAADATLKTAKNAGRNQLKVWENPNRAPQTVRTAVEA